MPSWVSFARQPPLPIPEDGSPSPVPQPLNLLVGVPKTRVEEEGARRPTERVLLLGLAPRHLGTDTRARSIHSTIAPGPASNRPWGCGGSEPHAGTQSRLEPAGLF